MSDPAEASLAVAAAHETGLPVVACMTFDSGAKKDRTMMGATPEQAAEQLVGRRGRRDRLQLRPGHRRHGRHLPPAARRHRSADLDQGQRRPAGDRRRQDDLPPDARRVRRLRAALVDAGARSSAAAAAPRPSSSARWRRNLTRDCNYAPTDCAFPCGRRDDGGLGRGCDGQRLGRTAYAARRGDRLPRRSARRMSAARS